MPNIRRNLFVFPNYVVTELDGRTFTVLQKCGVLPSDLRLYHKTGAREDKNVVLHLVGKDAHNIAMEGTVTAHDLIAAVRTLFQKNDIAADVISFVFCGHGHVKDDQIEMVCSYNQRVTLSEIHDIIQASGYSGTYIQIINICSERDTKSHIPHVLPSDTLIRCHTCSIFANSDIQDVYDKHEGSTFFQTMKEVVKNYTVNEATYMTYERIDEISDKFPRCDVTYSDRNAFTSLMFGQPVVISTLNVT